MPCAFCAVRMTITNIASSAPTKPGPLWTMDKRKPGPDGPGLVRQRGGAGDTFQRGTAACTPVAYLGGWRQPIAQQHDAIMRFQVPAHNAMVDMSAMRSSQSAARGAWGRPWKIVPGRCDTTRFCYANCAPHSTFIRLSHVPHVCIAWHASITRHGAASSHDPVGSQAGLLASARNSSAARWRPESRGTPGRAPPT
jgi:hypothetical protein